MIRKERRLSDEKTTKPKGFIQCRFFIAGSHPFYGNPCDSFDSAYVLFYAVHEIQCEDGG